MLVHGWVLLYWHHGFRCRWSIAQCTMWSLRVLALFTRHFYPSPRHRPLDPLVVDLQSGITQQRCDSPIAVTTLSPRQGNDVSHQSGLISTRQRHSTLRGAMLAQHLADPPLRDLHLDVNMLDTPATTSCAQKFPLAASARICLSSVRSETAFRRRSFSFCKRLL